MCITEINIEGFRKLDERIKRIRESEKLSHIKTYTSEQLYKSDGWLKAPIKTVIDIVAYFDHYNEINILDLGCGVGRNAIFLADKFKNINATVDCVDLLPLAIEKLLQYSDEYGVRSKINGIVDSIENFTIKPNYYNLIIAVSSLEHINCLRDLREKLQEIKVGLRKEGVICFVMNTSVQEFNKNTNEKLDAEFEVNLNSEYALKLFGEMFLEYEILKSIVVPQKYEIPRDGYISNLTTNVVTFVARNI